MDERLERIVHRRHLLLEHEQTEAGKDQQRQQAPGPIALPRAMAGELFRKVGIFLASGLDLRFLGPRKARAAGWFHRMLPLVIGDAHDYTQPRWPLPPRNSANAEGMG